MRIITFIVLLAGSTSTALAQMPLDADFAVRREWVVSQPRSFENEVLFTIRDGEVLRSDRYSTAGSFPGDFDGDDDIDLHDYNAFQICLTFSGPDIMIPQACLVFDSDADQDVDLEDADAFLKAFTGALGGVLVEAGELFPVVASPDGYYSGPPGAWGNNALNGFAQQRGYTQSDLWYHWSLLSKPEASGSVIIANASRPETAYSVLPPLAVGRYRFHLAVTNLVTLEFSSDVAVLNVVQCLTDAHCDDGAGCTADVCDAGTNTCGHPDSCQPGQTCNLASGHCEPFPPCQIDADCANELFCNGSAVCVEATCFAGPDPCAPDEICDDSLDACLPPPGCLDFTLNADNLVRSVGACPRRISGSQAGCPILYASRGKVEVWHGFVTRVSTGRKPVPHFLG